MLKHASRNFTPFKEGQKVWLEATSLRIPGASTKFLPKRTGPFVIKEKLSDLVYKLKLPNQWKIHNTFHASLLTPFKENDIHSPNFTRPPPELLEGEEEWEVDEIISHRTRGQGYQYRVKWKGYPITEATWEPESNLQNSLQLLTRYKNNHNLLQT